MAKSANLYARIEPDLKEGAESILSALGISASNAITLFYKQIVLCNGLPFEVKLPAHPNDVSKMTMAEFNEELERGYAETQARRTISATEAFSQLHEEYGI